jgi:hypothetical protein
MAGDSSRHIFWKRKLRHSGGVQKRLTDEKKKNKELRRK